MVVFLAPYGIVAQPIHTTVLPRLASEVQAGDWSGVRASVRWAADAMVFATVPIAAVLAALSAPIMSVLAFGEAADGDGPEILGAALLGLAIGVPVYGGFLLLTRVAYALGDSRTPAVTSMGAALLGGAGMLAAAVATDGADRLVLLGLAHTAAYALGAAVLAVWLAPRAGAAWHTGQLVPLGMALVAGGLAWVAMEAWAPDGRVLTLVAVVVVGAAATALYAAGAWMAGAVPPRSPVIARGAAA
jgi:putative peptidoglycan lipid II flippase